MDTKKVLDDLREFVKKEHDANFAQLYEVWEKPLHQKLESGETQSITSIKIEDKKHLVVTLGENDSRFREGDMICLHLGDVKNEFFVRQARIEAENEREWLLQADFDRDAVKQKKGICYADADAMDLKSFFDKAFDDVANLSNGRKVLLPLLTGELTADKIYSDNYDNAANYAEEAGLNEKQINAVGLGVAAQYLACIQGPPGTGKTKVISIIAKLLVAEGQTVLLTSHTHMAINNALNKVANEGVPTIKVGAITSNKGLEKDVPRFDLGNDWEERPDCGYVIGATPFSTCSLRLDNFEFDTVIFDEASQITVPLAIMAMRKGKRFVFVGDHKQLPPVVVSKSVLDEESYSVFSKLVLGNETVSEMLDTTYRMNKWLVKWPSLQYYEGNLVSEGDNSERCLKLIREPKKYYEVFSPEHPFVFILSPGVNARTQNKAEASLVVNLIQAAVDAGLPLEELGVVTPYRNHGKMIKNQLSDRLGVPAVKRVVIDTVERMQGQEREVIIISLCSTDKQFIQSVASFFFQPERLNVAITRPKVKLILIGPEIPDRFCVDKRSEGIQDNIDAYRSLVNSAKHFRLGGE